jgi:hypothetical protein
MPKALRYTTVDEFFKNAKPTNLQRDVRRRLQVEDLKEAIVCLALKLSK